MPADEALLDAPVDDVEVDSLASTTRQSRAKIPRKIPYPIRSAKSSRNPRQTTDPVIPDASGQSQTLRRRPARNLTASSSANPKLARELRAALFDRADVTAEGSRRRKGSPGNHRILRGRGRFRGGSGQVKGELDAWKGLDADFQGQNPKFVEDIAAGNPEAFVFHAPGILAKLEQVAPEVFSYHVSKVFAGDMQANDVVLNLRLMQREISMLPENERGPIEAIWKQLAGYVDRVNNMSKTAPKAADKPVVNGAAKPEGLESTREQALTVREFGSERTRILESVTGSEFKRQMGNRKASSEQISAIQELYQTRLDRMLRSDKSHTDKVDRFLSAKDKAGYRKHMEAAYRMKAPAAMAAAFKAILPWQAWTCPESSSEDYADRQALTINRILPCRPEAEPQRRELDGNRAHRWKKGWRW